MSALTPQLKIEQACIKVSGALTFATVSALRAASQNVFSGQSKWSCDLSLVSACDSAGLALLIDWLKLAKQQHKDIHFLNLPAQLKAIASAAGFDKLLEA